MNLDISTEQFIKQNESILGAKKLLYSMITGGKIDFPYQRLFCKAPEILFDNLKKINLAIISHDYHLYSYYPDYNSYLPAKFRGKPIIIKNNSSYLEADVITDYFIENIRIKSKRYDQSHSIAESWNKDTFVFKIIDNLLQYERINNKSLRSAIYFSIAETKVFNVTWIRALIKLVFNGENIKDKKYLDISSGWGDRLLVAMSFDMEYLGYDPNTELREKYDQMINLFGNKDKHKVISEPFEKAILPENYYDIVLSSPPFFDVEEYSKEAGQSIVSYPKFDDWMIYFLFVSLEKAWKSLKIGGFLVLHLGDTKIVRISEPANIFIENHLLNSSWEGIIGLQGELGYPRPVWVWRKVASEKDRIIWNTSYVPYEFKFPGQLNNTRRTLKNTYPNLYDKYINK